MPSPSPQVTLTTLRPDLQPFFDINYDLLASQFVGLQVFPVTETGVQSGIYPEIPLGEQLRHTQTGARTNGAGYWRDVASFTTGSFATQEYGFEELVDYRAARQYANYLQAELFAVQRSLNKLLTRQEMRIAAKFDTTAYTAAGMVQAKSAGQWDAAGSKPLDDVEAAVRKVYDASGIWPNALVISQKTFRSLRLNAQVQDAIRAAGAGFPTRAEDVTTQMLSAVFALPKIIVGGGSKNTAAPGATPAISQIWPNNAIVAVVAETQDFSEPCVGRSFHWGEDGSMVRGAVESYEEPQNRATVVRCRHDVDEKLLYLKLACMILTVVT